MDWLVIRKDRLLELPEVQRNVLAFIILTMPDNERRKHRNPNKEGWFSMSYLELEEWFGRGQFPKICVELDVLEVGPWNKEMHQTRYYRLTPEMAEIRAAFLNYMRSEKNLEHVPLIKRDGKEVYMTPLAIRKHDSDGRRRKGWKTYNIANPVLYNVEAINKIREAWPEPDATDLPPFIQAMTEDTRKLWDFVLADMHDLTNTTFTKGKGMFQQYVESPAGRIYGQDTHFQRTPRDLRKASFAGFYEYDMDNAHYAFGGCLGTDLKLSLPGIAYYNANKKAVRDELAADLNVDVQQIKDALIAKIYGAGDSDDPAHAIPEILGDEKAQELYAHPLFRAISDDLKILVRAIIDSLEPDRLGRYHNAMSKPISSKEEDRFIMSHLFQGLEAKAMENIVAMCEPLVLLVIHDGLIVSEPIDTKAIERWIFEAIGYHISVSEEELKMPAIFDELYRTSDGF